MKHYCHLLILNHFSIESKLSKLFDDTHLDDIHIGLNKVFTLFLFHHLKNKTVIYKERERK
jgi:hypothetical protein